VQLQETIGVIKDKIRGYQEGKLTTVHHPSSQMIRIHQMRLAATRGRKYDIVRIGEVEGLTLIPKFYSIEELRKLGVEYIIVSSNIYNWFEGKKGRETYPRHAAFYRRLFDTYQPVKEFSSRLNPGPTIKIYKLTLSKVER